MQNQYSSTARKAMEEPNNRTRQHNNCSEGNMFKTEKSLLCDNNIDKHESCSNTEVHKFINALHEQNINETQNSDNFEIKEVALKENSDIEDNVTIAAEKYSKDQEIIKIDLEIAASTKLMLKRKIDIYKDDDNDHDLGKCAEIVKNSDDDKLYENKTLNEGSEKVQESEKKSDQPIKHYDSDKDIKEDMKFGTEIHRDVAEEDDKMLKRYTLRQRQSVKYTFDEPPPPLKKNKLNNQQNNSKAAYDCLICNSTYETKKGFAIHMVLTHNQAEKFTCAQCSMEFLTNRELIDHKKVHDKDDDIFSCVRCKVAYSNILEFLQHKADHYRTAEKWPCVECNRVFGNRHLYKNHLFSHFEATFKCNICEKVFKNKQGYGLHMKSHDEEIAQYACGECGKKCNDKKHFEYHMSTHTGLKLYQCLYCGKGFSNSGQRKVHTRIHTNEKPYECTLCKKTFRQFTDLNRHMPSHDAIQQKFICDHCGQVYSHKPTLAIHMRIHTRQNLITCPICNKKFPLHALLKSHFIYQHMDDKPYKCDVCKIAFKKLCGLQRHWTQRKHRNAIYGMELKDKKLNEKGQN